MTKINPNYKFGKGAIEELLKLTSEAKDKITDAEQIILYLEEKGVFD
jgi:hypothetical protein